MEAEEKLIEENERKYDELVEAIEKYDFERVKELLKTTDPNIRNKMSYVPLFAAVGSHNTEMIELLLEYGADINARVTMPYAWQYGASVIRFAENKLHLIKFLVEHGADPSDEVAFAFAISEDRLDIIEYLVEQGAQIDVYKQDRFGNSLIKKASPRIAKYLEFAFPKENE